MTGFDFDYYGSEDDDTFFERLRNRHASKGERISEEADDLRPGPKITCFCGTCQKCRKRVWQRNYRAGKRIRLPYSKKSIQQEDSKKGVKRRLKDKLMTEQQKRLIAMWVTAWAANDQPAQESIDKLLKSTGL